MWNRAILGFTLVALGATVASASNVPSVANSTRPDEIRLVGFTGSTADPRGAFTFVLRLINNDPIAGGVVNIDFRGCTDLRISPTALDPGIHLDCATQTISGTTDFQGQITFHVVGAATGGGPRALPDCAVVTANGVRFPNLRVSAFDLDGGSGVNGIDLSLFGADLYATEYRPRSDHNGDGRVDGIDLGILGAVLTGTGSTASGSTLCTP